MSLLAVVATTAQASNVEGNAKYKNANTEHGTRNKEFLMLNVMQNANAECK
jgi:hypothetical protein